MRRHQCDFDEAIIEGVCGGIASYPDNDYGVCETPVRDMREAESCGITPGMGSG